MPGTFLPVRGEANPASTTMATADRQQPACEGGVAAAAGTVGTEHGRHEHGTGDRDRNGGQGRDDGT